MMMMNSSSLLFAFVFALVVFGGSGVLVRFDRCNSQRILCLHVISTEDDVNMNVTEMDDFEPIQGDGEVEIELQEDPESVAEVQAMKDAVEEEYEEVVIPNSMELQKMTKAKIKEVADSIGITVSDNQTKSAMIKDFEEEKRKNTKKNVCFYEERWWKWW